MKIHERVGAAASSSSDPSASMPTQSMSSQCMSAQGMSTSQGMSSQGVANGMLKGGLHAVLIEHAIAAMRGVAVIPRGKCSDCLSIDPTIDNTPSQYHH